MNKILIVDEEEAIQILYADELAEEGYEVVTSGDGLGLIDLIEKTRPDLVVLDIRLRDHNGLDLLQDIRNAYGDLPVIFCTAYPALEYNLNSIAPNYYVVKSSDLSELKLQIKTAMKSKTEFMERPMPEDINESKTNQLIKDEVNHGLQN